ncbi:MAG: molybdenum cofactor guanylyltransferase [Acidobacteriota bacterium]
MSSRAEPPLFGGLLVGGRSRRMGRSKQLLRLGASTLLERAAAALEPAVDELVLLGAGEVPPALSGLRRIADASGAQGPLAGLLAALASTPTGAWLIAACDLPAITPAAVAWLLEQRRRGRRAILPRLDTAGVEPLLALYEPAALSLLLDLQARGISSLQPLAGMPGVFSPRVPAALRSAWRNVNTPQELAALRSESR